MPETLAELLQKIEAEVKEEGLKENVEALLPPAAAYNDDKVLHVLHSYGKPLSVSMAALLLNMDPAQCKRVFNSLLEYGKIKLATTRQTSFYIPK